MLGSVVQQVGQQLVRQVVRRRPYLSRQSGITLSK